MQPTNPPTNAAHVARVHPTRRAGARSTLAAGLIALWLAFSPAHSSAHADEPAPAPPPAANTMCPVMTDEPIDPDISLLHDGQTVHFCCQKCRRLFEAAPDKYLPHLPQFGGTPPYATPAAANLAANNARANDDDDDDDDDKPSASSRNRASVPLLERLGRFHVVSVHFPIALLCIAALVELVRPKRPHTDPESHAAFTVRLLAWLGAAGALLAMTLGLIHEESVEATLSGAAHETLELHELTGIAVAVAATLVAIALQTRAAQPTTLIAKLAAPLLYLVALAIAFTAHLGGKLVYGPNFLIPW